MGLKTLLVQRWVAPAAAALALSMVSAGAWLGVHASATPLPSRVARPPLQQLVPLAGSGDGAPHVVVFGRYESRRTSTGAVRRTHRGNLIAVAANHQVRHLGRVTADMRDFSLTGDYLTAVSAHHPSSVYWWTVTPRSRHGVGTVTRGRRYAAATQNGWLEVARDGTLYDHATGTRETFRVARPFRVTGRAALHVVAGPIGWVASNRRALAYIDEAGDVTHLEATTIGRRPRSYLDCWSVSTTAAACGSVRTSDRGRHIANYTNFLVPLDGGRLLEQSTYCGNPSVAVGNAMAWSCGQPDHLRHGNRIGLVSQVNHQRRSAPGKLGVGTAAPLAGSHGFVVTNRAQTEGLLFSSSLKAHRVYLPPVRSSG